MASRAEQAEDAPDRKRVLRNDRQQMETEKTEQYLGARALYIRASQHLEMEPGAGAQARRLA